MIKYLVLIYSTLFVIACRESNKELQDKSTPIALNKARIHSIDSIKKNIHNGDIILRRGNDIISHLFAQFNKQNKLFSHCGIAFYTHDTLYVYHSIGGEDNPNATLRKDKFDIFVSPQNNHAFGICRYPLSDNQIKKLKNTVDSFYNQKIPFDMQFDLNTNNKLYCAEMIAKALQCATSDSTYVPTTLHQGFKYFSTDNLFINKHAQFLCYLPYY